MSAILLLEDDDTISFAIRTCLEQAGHTLICCSTLAQARAALSPSVQLAVLDVNLPDGCGYDLLRSIRASSAMPVIFLTVRDDELNITKGLDMGADDYITKPFQLSVLKSRIQAVLRRTLSEGESLLSCSGICLDQNQTRVWSEGTEVFLTGNEYRLLLTLMMNKNKTMTRTLLLEKLWDIDGSFVNDNTLTVTMKRLRERLGNPECIRTLRRIGYRMEDSI